MQWTAAWYLMLTGTTTGSEGSCPRPARRVGTAWARESGRRARAGDEVVDLGSECAGLDVEVGRRGDDLGRDAAGLGGGILDADDVGRHLLRALRRLLDI